VDCQRPVVGRGVSPYRQVMGLERFTRFRAGRICGDDTKNSDKSSDSVTGRADPRRVLRWAGGHEQGACGSGSRVGNHRVRRSWTCFVRRPVVGRGVSPYRHTRRKYLRPRTCAERRSIPLQTRAPVFLLASFISIPTGNAPDWLKVSYNFEVLHLFTCIMENTFTNIYVPFIVTARATPGT